MAINKTTRARIRGAKEAFAHLAAGREALLAELDELELPEAVYNSNAIEQSTLTLRETEHVLRDEVVAREVSARELHEAKNLAQVAAVLRRESSSRDLTLDTILTLHRVLMADINDRVAGRLRGPGERVRVGLHLAPESPQITRMLENALAEYAHDHESYDLDKVARFHLEFEYIHPFNDGNGRIGRILMNWQLARLGFPPVIIRDTEKRSYYATFRAYELGERDTGPMARILARALLESLHKRIARLSGAPVVALADYAKARGLSTQALINKARRQTLPAFRERGAWVIADK